jgi:hypothetical protein
MIFLAGLDVKTMQHAVEDRSQHEPVAMITSPEKIA